MAETPKLAFVAVLRGMLSDKFSINSVNYSAGGLEASKYRNSRGGPMMEVSCSQT